MGDTAPDDPQSSDQPARGTGKPGHNRRTSRPPGARHPDNRNHRGQRHPRTRRKASRTAQRTARGTAARPGARNLKTDGLCE